MKDFTAWVSRTASSGHMQFGWGGCRRCSSQFGCDGGSTFADCVRGAAGVSMGAAIAQLNIERKEHETYREEPASRCCVHGRVHRHGCGEPKKPADATVAVEHKVIDPAKMEWGDPPPGLPAEVKAGVKHYAWASEETVIQINGERLFGIKHVIQPTIHGR